LPGGRHRSNQIAIARRQQPRFTSRGFLPWRLSDDGLGASPIIASGRHPKPFTGTDVVLSSRRPRRCELANSVMTGTTFWRIALANKLARIIL
jgi:hypothetical protein